jgi:hypothetical protein
VPLLEAALAGEPFDAVVSRVAGQLGRTIKAVKAKIRRKGWWDRETGWNVVRLRRDGEKVTRRN